MMRRLRMALGASLVLALSTVFAAAQDGGKLEPLRVGVLKFGTVNWELDTMTRNGIDAKHGVDVEIVPFASEDASNVAFQAGDVDVIVTDWLWVSRERQNGADFTFSPYSTSVGSLMVPGDSDIHDLADLKGRKIGVAGGPLDKNWLLIQALAKRESGIDLASAADVVYGAPPLLTEKAKSGELDAVLNFWHYAARLEAAGFRTLISGTDAATKMGASGPVAAIGWVFRNSFARKHPKAIEGFLAADQETDQLLKSSDEAWTALEPLVRPENRKTLETLRDRYRQGIPSRSVEAEAKDAAKLYEVLATIGGERLVGPGETLAKGTFWTGPKDGS